MVTSSRRRKDAVQNRSAIVAAAAELMASGDEASFRMIASRANVGLATVYRHFRDRRDLLLALLEPAVERLEELASTLPSDDPGTFVILLRAAVDEQAHCQGLTSALRRDASGRVHVDRLTGRVRVLFGEPLTAAKAAGVVRSDVALDEVVLVSQMIDGALAQVSDPAARGFVAARSLELLLAGVVPRPAKGLDGLVLSAVNREK